MIDKEQIIIHGIDVSKCKYHNNGWCELPESTDDVRNKPCGDMTLFDCYYKQLDGKTQELEELKDYARRQENQRETYYKEFLKKAKALEEIEELAKDGLNPICYKSNCSRCKCYNGDDCKAGMISLINNYFTENGEFADGNGDFAEALEYLLDKERSRCNRALPISKKILYIINKAKGGEDE